MDYKGIGSFYKSGEAGAIGKGRRRALSVNRRHVARKMCVFP